MLSHVPLDSTGPVDAMKESWCCPLHRDVAEAGGIADPMTERSSSSRSSDEPFLASTAQGHVPQRGSSWIGAYPQ